MHSHTPAIFLALATASVTTNATAAGFDCTKAKKSIERMICADAEISAMDTTMSERYRALLESLPVKQRSLLKEDQLYWLQERDHAKSADRLRASYKYRLDALEAKRLTIADGKFHPFGDYVVTHHSEMYQGEKEGWVDIGFVQDVYSFTKIDGKTISFEIGISGTNGSECGAGGKATLSDDGKTYLATLSSEEDVPANLSQPKDKDEDEVCHILITVLKDHVRVTPSGGEACHHDCGMRAFLHDQHLFPAQKTVPNPQER